jgi:prepilin-type N-terminal cleavage/methylation domain-containing protein
MFFRRRESADCGFTLTEMMAVLVILSILALIAVSSYFGASKRAAAATCMENQRMIELAIPVYMGLNEGEEPASIDDLEPYVRTWANVTRCPADRNVALSLDPVTLKVSCPLHPR